MKHRKITAIAAAMASLFLTGTTEAGFFGLTVHSRANCLNNESITWDATCRWGMVTMGTHLSYIFNTQHGITDDQYGQDAWRSASVHWGEGLLSMSLLGLVGFWMVDGHHRVWNNADNVMGEYYTRATGCNTYDGWWGYNPRSGDSCNVDPPDHLPDTVN